MDNLKKMMGLDVAAPQIKLRPLDELVPYYRNSRTHSPAQIELLQRLMLEFGFTNTVLIDDQGIVAGHGRCMALEALYKRGEQIKFPSGTPIPIGLVPTMDVSGWSAQQRRAYIIADNASAEYKSHWDVDMLRLELTELDEAGFDLTLTAFDEAKIDELLAEVVDLPPGGDPDAQPEPPENPVCVTGDTWCLGAHKLHCGDATSTDAWDRLMAGERSDVVWVDPPFNVDLGRKNRLMDKAVGGSRSATGSISNDKMTDEEFTDLLQGIYTCLFAVMKPGAPIYVAHADRVGRVFRNLFEDCGFHFSQMLIWNKGQMVLGMSDHQSSHESIMYGWKPGSKHRWYGGRKNKTVFEIGEGGPIQKTEDGRWCVKVGDSFLIVSGDATIEEAPGSVFYEPKPEKSGLHPSTKPVALIERQLKNSARTGDLVVDACGGSGSTLIAADRLGMCARIMELEPRYCDVIVQRWQDYTGRRAVHADTGALFGDGPELAPEQRSAPKSIFDIDAPDIF